MVEVGYVCASDSGEVVGDVEVVSADIDVAIVQKNSSVEVDASIHSIERCVRKVVVAS